METNGEERQRRSIRMAWGISLEKDAAALRRTYAHEHASDMAKEEGIPVFRIRSRIKRAARRVKRATESERFVSVSSDARDVFEETEACQDIKFVCHLDNTRNGWLLRD